MEKRQTFGTPNTPVGAKAFYKPSMGRLILRKPGVLRRSDKVIAVNKLLVEAKVKPATKCKGMPWKKFVSCLRGEMGAIISKETVAKKLEEMMKK